MPPRLEAGREAGVVRPEKWATDRVSGNGSSGNARGAFGFSSHAREGGRDGLADGCDESSLFSSLMNDVCESSVLSRGADAGPPPSRPTAEEPAPELVEVAAARPPAAASDLTRGRGGGWGVVVP